MFMIYSTSYCPFGKLSDLWRGGEKEREGGRREGGRERERVSE
jgi:hypothetical protein